MPRYDAAHEDGQIGRRVVGLNVRCASGVGMISAEIVSDHDMHRHARETLKAVQALQTAV